MEIDITKYWNKITSCNGSIYLSDLKLECLQDKTDPFASVLNDCVRRNERSGRALSELINALPGSVQVVFEDEERFPKNPLLNTLSTIINKPFVSGKGVGTNPGLGLNMALQHYIRGLDEGDKLNLKRLGKQREVDVDVDTGAFSCDLVELLSMLQSVEDHHFYHIIVQLQSERSKWDEQSLLHTFNGRLEDAERMLNEESIDTLNCFKIFPIDHLSLCGESVTFDFEAEAGVFDTVGLGVVDYSAIQLQHGLLVGLNPFKEEDVMHGLCKKLLQERDQEDTDGLKRAIVGMLTPSHVLEFEVDRQCRRCHWKEQHTIAYSQFLTMIDSPELSPSCMKLMKEDQEVIDGQQQG